MAASAKSCMTDPITNQGECRKWQTKFLEIRDQIPPEIRGPLEGLINKNIPPELREKGYVDPYGSVAQAIDELRTELKSKTPKRVGVEAEALSHLRHTQRPSET